MWTLAQWRRKLYRDGLPHGADDWMFLNTSGRFLILDSAWSPERAAVNHKVERQPRRLNDGTTFDIYKRYCDRDDIARWATQCGAELQIEHFGPAFYAVSGTFRALPSPPILPTPPTLPTIDS